MENDAVSDVYHEGEIAVQRQAGVRERAEQLSGKVERTVPGGEDVRALVENQPHAALTSVDRDGAVWVSFLTGEPGFISIDDERTVRFAATPATGDPLADHLRPGMPAGVLLVDPRNRNRLRLNGTVEPTDGGVSTYYRRGVSKLPEVYPAALLRTGCRRNDGRSARNG